MKTMKRYILTALLLGLATSLSAQGFWELNPQKADLAAGRTFRTEVIPYDTRHDADARNREGSGYSISFMPEILAHAESMAIVAEAVDIPYAWTDGVVYLHLENVGAAYTLFVNDQLVAEVEDPLTPAEFHLTPIMHQDRKSVV